MTKKIKKLSVLTVALLAGLLISFTSTEVSATQLMDNNSEAAVSTFGNQIMAVILLDEIVTDNKCGEGKCGTATKESKKEGKKELKAEKKEGNVTTEKKCGEGKCGAAEKKEAKTEKKESKKETKEGKCGEGKCGVA